MAQANFKVLVRKNKKEAVVRPPFDTASKNKADGFEITNKTSQDILVSLPGNVFDFDNDAAHLADPGQVVTVAPGATKSLRTASDAEEGIHSYQVFCLETFSYAQGSSDPELIVQ